jgi:thiol-disulfide isomerase/thioredoxin
VSKLSADEIRAKLGGAPPALAAVHAQANDLLPGARKGLQARVKALRGHPVVVNVWAAWCGPCRVELPVVQSASLDWGKRVAFLGVDLKDNRGAANKLLRQIPLTYPSYEDPDGKVYNGYKLLGTPSTIYYDAAGKQTYIHTGPYQDRADFDADIKRYATS